MSHADPHLLLTTISIHQTLQQINATSVIELQLQSTDVKQMSMDCNV